MLKNITKLELKVNDHVHQYLTDVDTPLSDVKEALFQFQKYVGQIEDAVKAQQEQKKSEEVQQEDKVEQIG